MSDWSKFWSLEGDSSPLTAAIGPLFEPPIGADDTGSCSFPLAASTKSSNGWYVDILLVPQITRLCGHLRRWVSKLERRRFYLELVDREARLYLAQVDGVARLAGIVSACAKTYRPGLLDSATEFAGEPDIAIATKGTNEYERYLEIMVEASAAHARVFGDKSSSMDAVSEANVARLAQKMLPGCIGEKYSWDRDYAPRPEWCFSELSSRSESWAFLLVPEYQSLFAFEDVQDCLEDLCSCLADVTDELGRTECLSRLSALFDGVPDEPTYHAETAVSIWHAVLSLAQAHRSVDLRYSIVAAKACEVLRRPDVDVVAADLTLSKYVFGLLGNAIKAFRTLYATVPKETLSAKQSLLEYDLEFLELQSKADAHYKKVQKLNVGTLLASIRNPPLTRRTPTSDEARLERLDSPERIAGRGELVSYSFKEIDEPLDKMRGSLGKVKDSVAAVKYSIERREACLHLLIGLLGVASLTEQGGRWLTGGGMDASITLKALCDVAGSLVQFVGIAFKQRAYEFRKTDVASSALDKFAGARWDSLGQVCSFVSGVVTLYGEASKSEAERDPLKVVSALSQSATALVSLVVKLSQTQRGASIIASGLSRISGRAVIARLLPRLAAYVALGSVLNVVGYALLAVEVSIPLWGYLVKKERQSGRVAPVFSSMLSPLKAPRFYVDCAAELGIDGHVDALLAMMPEREEASWKSVGRVLTNGVVYGVTGTRFFVKDFDQKLWGKPPRIVSFFGLMPTFASPHGASGCETAREFADRMQKNCSVGRMDRDAAVALLAGIVGEEIAESMFFDSIGDPNMHKYYANPDPFRPKY